MTLTFVKWICFKLSWQIIPCLALIFLVLLLGIPRSLADQIPEPPEPPAFIPGEVLIMVRSENDDAGLADRIHNIGTSVENQPVLHIHRIKLQNGLSVENAVAELRKLDFIVDAGPNYIIHGSSMPNDSYYVSNQYGPQNIQGDIAWSIWRPQQQTIIAIVDSGIDYNHPDLTNKIYRSGGTVVGYDFINGDSDPKDDYGHGTFCAGIAAAQTNNGTGIAGMAGWNGLVNTSDTNYTKIMPVKVLDNTNSGTKMTSLNGITWAADHGAKVISMSYYGPYDSMENSAIQYAWNKGCILVSIAGNNQSNVPQYPAAYNNVISVAATDSSNILATFSNYGTWVNVAAPGVLIYSTVPTYPVPGFSIQNYASGSGTSFACPHVSGEAALIWAQNPNLSNTQVKNLITSIWDPYTPYMGRTISPTGGKVNVYRALRAAGLYRDYFDLNQDGTLDLLFENHATGEMAAWYLTGTGGVTVNGAAYIRNQIAPTPSYPQNPAWPVVGTGDFNSDGHPDLLFQNHSTGQMAVWYLGYTDGAVIQSAAYVNQSQVTSFPAVAAGDFDGDGHPDILFHNPTTGQLSVWFMGGTGGVVAQTGAYLSASQVVGWSVVGLGDFNQDGKLDILWTNPTTGQLALWYLDGIVNNQVQVKSAVYVDNSGYTPIGPARGVGDFNQDGVPDALFENLASGAMEVWYMGSTNGSKAVGRASISQAQSPAYPVELPH